MLPARLSAAAVAYGRGLTSPTLSPDGATVAVISTTNGRAAVALIPLDGGPERTLTVEPTPRGGLAWLPDGRGVVHGAPDGGLWLAPIGGGPPTPLVAGGKEPAEAPAVAPDGTRVAYVVGQRDVAVASLRDDGSWPVRLSRQNDFALDPSWNADSSFVAWQEWDDPFLPWDESRWSIAPADGRGIVVSRAEAGVQYQQPCFAPAGPDLAYLCDATGWLNLWVFGPDHDPEQPFVAEPFEHGGPSWGHGQRTIAWAPDGARVAFTRDEGGFGRLCVVDAGPVGDVGTPGPGGDARPAGRRILEIGKGVHGSLSWAGDHLVALRRGAVTPTQLLAYDASNGFERRVLAHTGAVGIEAAAAEPAPVTWPGDDGEPVHGFLYPPAPTSRPGDRPPPLLVWIHGGPTGSWRVEWRGRVPFFTERGWAVLAVNHRGSTGYGRAYTQAMRHRWGDLDVADVAAGMRAAAERGWGHPRGMVPIGGSAGGFVVLHLLGRHPELCAAGVALYPVTELFDLDDRTHRFEQHYNDALVGPLPAGAAAWRERSPLTFADRIAGPLLLLHGAADDNVPPEQSSQLAAAIEGQGGVVEHHEYEGEGHGWSRPATVIDELERTDDFLRRHVLRWLS